MSIKKFSHFLAESRMRVEPPRVENGSSKAATYVAMLERYGAQSVLDLSDEDFDKFHKELVESFAPLNEGEDIKDEESFREYAKKMLKQAHGDSYDEDKAKEVIDGLVSKAKEDDDWDAAVGKLQSSMG